MFHPWMRVDYYWEKSNKPVSRAEPRIKNYSNKTSAKGYDPLMPSGTNTHEIFYTQMFIKREQEKKVQIKPDPLIPIYRKWRGRNLILGEQGFYN